jgi:hypothetical protein
MLKLGPHKKQENKSKRKSGSLQGSLNKKTIA